jgi:hypothetical protein
MRRDGHVTMGFGELGVLRKMGKLGLDGAWGVRSTDVAQKSILRRGRPKILAKKPRECLPLVPRLPNRRR